VIVPDLIEPIVGWRVWVAEVAYTSDGELALGLNSLYFALCWPGDRPAVARCEHSTVAPCDDDDHLCGIHAAPTLERAAAYLSKRVRDPHEWAHHSTQIVVGTVELWGDVVEHEHGWRAKYARPSELYVPSFFKARGYDIYAGEALGMLERHYQVRTRMFRHWWDIAPAQAAA
jgi:hypothetical protein